MVQKQKSKILTLPKIGKIFMRPYYKPKYCEECGVELTYKEDLLCSNCIKTTIIRQCAWCKKILGKYKVESKGGVTHSICDECDKKYMGG